LHDEALQPRLEMPQKPPFQKAPSDARDGGIPMTRRRLLGSAAALGLSATAASAQDVAKWWNDLQGFGAGTGSPASSRPPGEKRQEQLNDLRTDAVPWRSDQMLDNMEGAIARYSQIVAKGGWPVIPPGPMLRAGDEGERVALLRRRP
jgi:L,D-transpeptidase YcbB